jgi:hypothetical protein
LSCAISCVTATCWLTSQTVHVVSIDEVTTIAGLNAFHERPVIGAGEFFFVAADGDVGAGDDGEVETEGDEDGMGLVCRFRSQGGCQRRVRGPRDGACAQSRRASRRPVKACEPSRSHPTSDACLSHT